MAPSSTPPISVKNLGRETIVRGSSEVTYPCRSHLDRSSTNFAQGDTFIEFRGCVNDGVRRLREAAPGVARRPVEKVRYAVPRVKRKLLDCRGKVTQFDIERRRN